MFHCKQMQDCSHTTNMADPAVNDTYIFKCRYFGIQSALLNHHYANQSSGSPTAN